MMKQNYNNKTKLRSAWLALVLLMITALPITAQTAGERFQSGDLWYEVVDAANHTVKLTYGNKDLNKSQATQQVLADEKADLSNEWKGYNGKPKVTLEEEFITETPFNSKTPEADQKHNVSIIKVPATVKYNNEDWTVVAIGSYAFINERGIDKVELPGTIEAIEDASFYQCSVTMMNFPASLKYIGWRAFYKNNLAPYSKITRKGSKRKFKYSKTYLPIKILGKTAIGPQAFEGSFSKSEFQCPNITFVGYQAFKGDKFNITTPIPVTAKIGEATNDPKITDMYKNLPAGTDQRSGVESFAEYSYVNSDNSSAAGYKSAISLAEGPTKIPKGMFKNAFNKLQNFVIPSTVTEIEEEAFANVDIHNYNDLSKITKFGARAFENGIMSGDFVIGEQIEEVGDGAFAGNKNLTGFSLKGSANCKIGAGILDDCPNLEYVDLRNVKNEDFKKNLKNLSREFNSHTITSGLPTHTLVFLPDEQGITIAAGQDVNFVKSDGKCTKLSLQDGAEYEFLCDITANEVVYNRCNMTIKKQTIKRGYNKDLTVDHYEGDNSLTSYREFSSFANGKNRFTIFLPYAVKLPDGIRAYTLDKYGEDVKTNEWGEESRKEFYLFNSIPDGSELKANTPYLLRITDGGTTHSSKDFDATATPVQIAASGNDKYNKSGRLKPKVFIPDMSDQSYGFTGSTEKIPRDNEEFYKISHPWTLSHNEDGSDIWIRMPDVKPLQDSLIPPFRGIIMPKDGISAAKQFVLLDESNHTTGINDVTGNADAQQGAQRIYTIDGRYVGTNLDSLPSGMYIMKGNKTLKTK